MYTDNNSILGELHCDRPHSNPRLAELSSLRALSGRTHPASSDLSPNAMQEKQPRRRCDGSLGMNSEHSSNGWGLYEYPLAMVYSPYQQFRNLYSPEIALERGTVFTELDLPFEASGINGG